jgi:hypothetical protein
MGCDWHTVMDAVVVYGTPLIEDPDRFGTVTAVGLDETLFAREGPYRRQLWSTQIVDVTAGQLLDIVPGRDAVEPCRWFAAQPEGWRAGIAWATLDLSASYRTVFDTMVPDAVQVADPFHVVRVANTALDECRRRVQNEVIGHRGRRPDPLYRARRLLTMAAERLPDHRRERLVGLLAAGDPKGEVKLAWHAKEVVRQIYQHTDPTLAEAWVDEISPRLRRPGDASRGASAGSHDPTVAGSDRGLAPLPGEQRADRGHQQPREEGEARGVRDAPVPELPAASSALRRPTLLGPARQPHPTMRSEEPD